MPPRAENGGRAVPGRFRRSGSRRGFPLVSVTRCRAGRPLPAIFVSIPRSARERADSGDRREAGSVGGANRGRGGIFGISRRASAPRTCSSTWPRAMPRRRSAQRRRRRPGNRSRTSAARALPRRPSPTGRSSRGRRPVPSGAGLRFGAPIRRCSAPARRAGPLNAARPHEAVIQLIDHWSVFL